MEPYLHLPDDNTGVDSLAKFYIVPSPLLYMGRTTCLPQQVHTLPRFKSVCLRREWGPSQVGGTPWHGLGKGDGDMDGTDGMAWARVTAT